MTFPGPFVCLPVICLLSGRNQFMPGLVITLTLPRPQLIAHVASPGHALCIYCFLVKQLISSGPSSQGVSVSVRCHHCCDGHQSGEIIQECDSNVRHEEQQS